MMGWIVGAAISSAFLWFAGPQVIALLVERGPTSLSCRDFQQRGTTARWVSLHDCELDWNQAREVRLSRSEKALFVPLAPEDQPRPHQLFVRVERGGTDRERITWRGMVDTPSADTVPDFAKAESVHVLYTNRPSVVEVVLGLVPAFVFIAAATRGVRRRAVRIADAQRLRTRFPAGVGDHAEHIELGPAVSAARLARIAAIVAVASAASASITVAAIVATSAAVPLTVAALSAAGVLVIVVCWQRAALDDRLRIIGRTALAASIALAVLLVVAARGFGPAIVAIPLLFSAALALRARRTLQAVPNGPLLRMLRAAHRLPRQHMRHSSASRRPFRVIANRVSAVVVVAIGTLTIVATGTSVLMWIGTAAGILLWNRGTRHATFDARTVMERDPRPPVLLLRSFSDDDLEAKGTLPMPWSFTQTLAFVAAKRLQAVGPVVAIAPPNERLPPLGPYRVFVQKEDWRAEVDRLIADARSIVLFLGYSAGVLWELRRLIDGERAADIVLVVPPAEPASLEKRWAALIQITQQHPTWSAVRSLDPTSTLLMRCLPDGRLLVFHGRQENAAYDWAFQFCAASLHGSSPQPETAE